MVKERGINLKLSVLLAYFFEMMMISTATTLNYWD